MGYRSELTRGNEFGLALNLVPFLFEKYLAATEDQNSDSSAPALPNWSQHYVLLLFLIVSYAQSKLLSISSTIQHFLFVVLEVLACTTCLQRCLVRRESHRLIAMQYLHLRSGVLSKGRTPKPQ